MLRTKKKQLLRIFLCNAEKIKRGINVVAGIIYFGFRCVRTGDWQGQKKTHAYIFAIDLLVLILSSILFNIFTYNMLKLI